MSRQTSSGNGDSRQQNKEAEERMRCGGSHMDPNTKPMPIWLDCDTGHDDAFAILLSAQNNAVNLLGVSTIYGNASLSNTTYNTRAILKAIDREDVSVYAGASKPFCRAPASAPDIHGESGLDGTTHLPEPIVPPRNDVPAILAMYKALIAQPATSAYLVAVGSLTNVALLFATFPDLAEHIAGLSIMGGAVGGEFTDAPMGAIQGQGERFGNWTPWAEFNIYLDPEAAQAVFSNPVLSSKITLVPLDLTHQMLATPQICESLMHGFEQQEGTDKVAVVRMLFNQILTFFAKTYADVFGLTEGPPLHDPLAVAACFAPDLFNDDGGERFSVSVVTDGDHGNGELARTSSQCGRTLVTQLPLGEAGVRIPRSLESLTIWRMIEIALHQAETSLERKGTGAMVQLEKRWKPSAK